MSGLENVPPSELNPEQLSPLRSPVSRVTVPLARSSPAPPSLPFVSENATDVPVKCGASGPVSVIAWPPGAVVSSVIVIESEAEFVALSAAVTDREPGSAAPDDQL